jgi:SAM-dependent methyltransferase
MRGRVQREDWNRRYSKADLLWSATPNRFLVSEAEGLAPGRALDLACGEGRNALWLAELGWRVIAVDFSSVAIEKARRRAADEDLDVDFICSDLLEYEPDPSTYDLVLVLYLQLPGAERRIVLSRAASALAPSGTFLLVGHDLTNMTEGVGGPSDPAVLYTPEELVSELPGLEIEKAERVFRVVADADRPAIDALVRARRPERL